jgi:hydroxypyruvate isomerase
MKASACIEMLYTEYPLLERIERAADQGFDAIEFWNWDSKDLASIKRVVRQTGIRIAAFQGNGGGTLINPADRETLVAGLKRSLAQAQDMQATGLLLLTDELGEDRHVRNQFPHLSESEKRGSVLAGLKELAPLAQAAGVTLFLEPLNNLVDHAGYWLKYSNEGAALIREVNSPNIRLLFDIYHQQITEGNLIQNILDNLDVIGHIHIADVPGRHQPGTGEINYANIFRRLNEAGYQGYVGFEFEPAGPSTKAAAQTLALLRC